MTRERGTLLPPNQEPNGEKAMPNRGRLRGCPSWLARTSKYWTLDQVLSNRSGFEVRTQKPTSRAELVSDGSNSHELRTKGFTCPLPQPPPLFIKKSCLCLSRLSFACYSLRLEKEPPLGFISSLEFLFIILVDEVRTSIQIDKQ